MVQRYRMPTAGDGTREDPARPKYFCDKKDIHLLYEVADEGCMVQVFLPDDYIPPWAGNSDVKKLARGAPLEKIVAKMISDWEYAHSIVPPAAPEPKFPRPLPTDEPEDKASVVEAENPDPVVEAETIPHEMEATLPESVVVETAPALLNVSTSHSHSKGKRKR